MGRLGSVWLGTCADIVSLMERLCRHLVARPARCWTDAIPPGTHRKIIAPKPTRPPEYLGEVTVAISVARTSIPPRLVLVHHILHGPLRRCQGSALISLVWGGIGTQVVSFSAPATNVPGYQHSPAPGPHLGRARRPGGMDPPLASSNITGLVGSPTSVWQPRRRDPRLTGQHRPD
jgi:hypothetical protein